MRFKKPKTHTFSGNGKSHPSSPTQGARVFADKIIDKRFTETDHRSFADIFAEEFGDLRKGEQPREDSDLMLALQGNIDMPGLIRRALHRGRDPGVLRKMADVITLTQMMITQHQRALQIAQNLVVTNLMKTSMSVQRIEVVKLDFGSLFDNNATFEAIYDDSQQFIRQINSDTFTNFWDNTIRMMQLATRDDEDY